MSTPEKSDFKEGVGHLVELQRDHDRSTTRIQQIANRVTNTLGRPSSLAVILLLIIAWKSGNFLASRFGIPALERFPFPDLAFVATVAALLVALLILTTQRHQDQLAERRAELTLQIALLSEKKVAKVIELLEEQRRENPMLTSRVDEQAEAMAKSIDPRDSLEKLKRRLPCRVVARSVYSTIGPSCWRICRSPSLMCPPDTQDQHTAHRDRLLGELGQSLGLF